MDRKLGAVPRWGGAEAYLLAQFHLDPSNRLATIHQRHRQTDRQTDRTGQRTDSIGRTVLQTVAQKLIRHIIRQFFQTLTTCS